MNRSALLKFMALPAALLPVLSCSDCERTPSELSPGFDTYEVPINFCSGETEPVAVSVRNIGDDAVNIESAKLEVADGRDADLENFDEPSLDVEKLLADEVSFVRVTYRTPEGAEQLVNLVITSDAAVNPELIVPIHASGLIPENREAICNGTAEGEGEGEAGEGEGEGGEGEGEGEAGEGEGEGEGEGDAG